MAKQMTYPWQGEVIKLKGQDFTFGEIAKAFWGDTKYVSTDGQFPIIMSELPRSTVFNAAMYKFDHATGNEALAAGSNLKKKNPALTTDSAEYRAAVQAKRQSMHGEMLAGTWGFKEKTQGPRIPSTNDKERIYNQFLVDMTVDALNAWVKKGDVKVGKALHTWVDPDDGKEKGIDHFAALFLASKGKAKDPKYATLGDERKALVQARTDADIAARTAKANAKAVVATDSPRNGKFAL